MSKKQRLTKLERRESAILDWVLVRLTDEELEVIAEQQEGTWRVPGHPTYERYMELRQQAEGGLSENTKTY